MSMRRPRPRISTQLARASDELAQAVREYLDERDNPAPDFTMRRVRAAQMREALDRYNEIRPGPSAR